jgi:uncharacterized protein (DUF2147 family)
LVLRTFSWKMSVASTNNVELRGRCRLLLVY